MVANSEFVGSAYSPVLHCNFESCKIHEFLAFLDWPGHGVQRDSDSEGTVSVGCAMGLGLGFRGHGVGLDWAMGLGFRAYDVSSDCAKGLGF